MAYSNTISHDLYLKESPTQRGANWEVPKWTSTWHTLFKKMYCSSSTPMVSALLQAEGKDEKGDNMDTTSWTIHLK